MLLETAMLAVHGRSGEGGEAVGMTIGVTVGMAIGLAGVLVLHG